MSSPLLEVVIGMAFLYVLLSLGVSALTELIASWLDRREKFLEAGLESLLREAVPNPALRGAILHHGLLRGPGRKKRADQKAEDERGPSAKPAEADVPGTVTRPAYIEPALFASAVVDVLRGDGRNLEERMRSADASAAVGQVFGALWKEAEEDVALFRAEVARWFDQMMVQLRDVYAASSRNLIFVLGLIVALLGNIDSVHIARTLWRDSGIRQATVAAAEGFVARYPDAPGEGPPLKEIREELEALAFPWGWTDTQWPGSPTFEGNDLGWWLNKLVGVLLTAFAISLGAPFWFDLLNRLLSFRGKPSSHEPRKEREGEQAVG